MEFQPREPGWGSRTVTIGVPCRLPDVPPSPRERGRDGRGLTLDTTVEVNKEDRPPTADLPEEATAVDRRRTPLPFPSTPKGRERLDAVRRA